MDKWQAIDAFWNSFGWSAYDENSVPDNAVMPYITYSASVAAFENPVALSGSLWIRSTSWAEISQKEEQIAKALSPFQLRTLENNEYLFLSQGAPFAQRMKDTDDSVKRIYINIMAEYFSAH